MFCPDVRGKVFKRNTTSCFVERLASFTNLISSTVPLLFQILSLHHLVHHAPQVPLQFYAEKGRLSALVNWTSVVATDNSGLTPKVTSNYQSPHRFSQGTHVITYTAVDQSGNKASCRFTVKVIGAEI